MISGSEDIRAIAKEYFERNPDALYDVRRAEFAYHKHLREEGAHNFLTPASESRCHWCGRSRLEVRWGDDDPRCGSRPSWIDKPIAEIVKEEEDRYEKVLQRALKVAESIDMSQVTGEWLSSLHHTHGIDPTALDGALAELGKGMLTSEQHEAYQRAYRQHRETGRAGLQKTEVKVKEQA